MRPCKQVVLNLLSNAIKFTPGSVAGPGGEVEVRTEVVSATAGPDTSLLFSLT